MSSSPSDSDPDYGAAEEPFGYFTDPPYFLPGIRRDAPRRNALIGLVYLLLCYVSVSLLENLVEIGWPIGVALSKAPS